MMEATLPDLANSLRRRASSSSNTANIVMPDGSTKPLDALFSGYGGGTGYSAALQSKNRGYIYFPQLDSRLEIAGWSRTATLRKSRWVGRNTAFGRGVKLGLVRMFGSLHPGPQTADKEWKMDALLYFWSIAGSPSLFDRSGKFTFDSYQNLITSRWVDDGDMAHLFTRGSTGQTQVMAVEGHLIDSPLNAGSDWFDGIQVDAGQRMRAMSIADMDDPEGYKTYRASKVHHTALWESASQPRGITPWHAALNRLVDVQELTADWMAGIKRSNLVGFYMYSQHESAALLGDEGIAGGLREHMEDMAGRTIDGGEKAQARYNIEDITQSGAIPEMKGVEPRVLHDARPPSQQMDLAKYFVHECALSFGYSSDVLWEMVSKNGNVSRFIKEQTEDQTAGYRNKLLKPFCQRYWFQLIGDAIDSGKLRMPSDGRWSEVDWIHPKRMTIDRGAEGKLNLDEHKALFRSFRTHFSEQQKDWQTEVGQSLDEIDWMEESMIARGWPQSRIDAALSAQLAPPAGTSVPSIAGDPAADPTASQSNPVDPDA